MSVLQERSARIRAIYDVRLPRPLPFSVTPLLDETVSSYIRRLARANHLNPTELRSYIAADPRATAPIPLYRLSIISGVSDRSLRYAMLDFCSRQELSLPAFSNRPRWGGRRRRSACSRCAAQRGVVEDYASVQTWGRLEDVVCLDHKQWISDTAPSVDLARHADIVVANKRHRRLVRHYGADAADRAFTAALGIRLEWLKQRPHNDVFLRRMIEFHGHSWHAARNDPTITASVYPDAVGLARLLVSPHWRSRILDDHHRRCGYSGHDRRHDVPVVRTRHWCLVESSARIAAFVAEAQRTVMPDFRWDPVPRMGQQGPFARWVLNELATLDRGTFA